MSNTNPTPSQLLAALRDHGADIKTYAGWDTIAKPWGNFGGLQGVVNHHTSTASATGSSGAPSLYWTVNGIPGARISNMLVGRGPGDTYLLAAGAGNVYHTGNGGPWPAVGITSSGNTGHLRLFGIEIDDPGRALTLTDYQIENVARVNAALMDLCGWDQARIITHQAWTDGSYGVNPNGPSPFLGRKGDTLHARWREYPGATRAEAYNPIFWRERAAEYARREHQSWDGTVPTIRAVQRGYTEGIANRAVWRVAGRMHDLGFRARRPLPLGRQRYPRAAVVAFQKSLGWVNPHGNFTRATQLRMFGKHKP